MKPKSEKREQKRKRSAISAKWRLIVLLILLMIISLVIIWTAQAVFVDAIYIRVEKKELRAAAEALSKTPYGEIRDKITEYGKLNNFCIAACLASGDGKIDVVDYEARPGCNCPIHNRIIRGIGQKSRSDRPAAVEKRLYEKIKELTFNNGGFCFLKESDVFTGGDAAYMKDNLTATALSSNDEGEELLLLINSSVVPVGTTLETLTQMMFYLSAIVVLNSVVFALLIALWITKPIVKINKAAKRLAQCEYEVRFEGKGYREVEELSDTLNYAALELSKTDRLQRELIANISHDLRTPLTMITGYAEAMRDLPGEMTRENLQIIIDESARMSALVKDILDISRLGSGTQTFTMTDFSLTDSVETELSRYNKLRDREGFVILFRYTERVRVVADCTRIMQVVYNLINNAVNYAGEDKTVIVTQTVSGGKVRISVTDHGEGIAPEELPKIWERYYKIDKTHRRATVGSGLGLAIVKGIVSAHKGDYGVTSESGKGSTFWFELDAASVEPLSNG